MVQSQLCIYIYITDILHKRLKHSNKHTNNFNKEDDKNVNVVDSNFYNEAEKYIFEVNNQFIKAQISFVQLIVYTV